METDVLNILVSGAIWRAEQLETLGFASAQRAWMEVASLEAELAKALPASSPEGRIARRGAVRAALKAGDFTHAQNLAASYLNDTPTMRNDLRRILDEDARS